MVRACRSMPRKRDAAEWKSALRSPPDAFPGLSHAAHTTGVRWGGGLKKFKGLEPTPYSVRCAAAFGRGSCLALGCDTKSPVWL